MNKINKLIKKLQLHFYIVMIRISNALVATDSVILKNYGEKISKKFGSGIESIKEDIDVKYVQQYYEILKKADKFMNESSNNKIATTATKYNMDYGMKDKYGRRYEHYGFYDENHKNYGKSLKEILELEMEKNRIKDDDYKLLLIVDNKPIELSINDIMNEELCDVVDGKIIYKDKLKITQRLKFPIKISRFNHHKTIDNKIEQLASCLHIKHMYENYYQLEFLIPKKFKLFENLNNNIVMDEIILKHDDIINITGNFDDKHQYNVKEYIKYIDFNGEFDVLKFKCVELEQVKLY